MQNNSCLNAIKNRYTLLTEAEKKVANYIVKNSAQIITMPIAALSDASGSVKSAIIRCCKSLGFDGYKDLKIALAMDLSKNKQFNYVPHIAPSDDANAILDKIFAAGAKTLHETAENLNRKTFTAVVAALKNANTVYIYGIGTSGAIVRELQFRLMEYGYTAIALTDIVSMQISTMNIKKGDIAIGISYGGQTIATVDALAGAKKAGATTIALTSRPQSAITEQSNLILEIHSDEIDYPMEAVSARIAYFCMIDAITFALSAQSYDETLRRSKQAHEFANQVRYKRGKK